MPIRPTASRCFAALLALALAGPGLAAQERPLDEMTLEELMNVEVTTVGRAPDLAWRVPAAVYVITRAAIERSGATNLAQALRLAPGMQVARIDAGKWAIGTRGFADRLARSMRVLIDGRAVYSPLFAGTYWETQHVPLEDIERIEVIRGPGGTLWGSNAVNGTISIITRRASDSRGLYASVGGGSEVLTGTVRYGQALGGQTFARVYAAGFDWGSQFHAAGDPAYDDWRLGQAGFRMDTNLPSGRTLTLIGEAYEGRLGQFVRETLLEPPYLQTGTERSPLRGADLLARWEGGLSARSQFQLQAYYEVHDRDEYPVSETRQTFDVDLQLRHRRFTGHRIDWGLGWQVNVEDLSTAPVASLPSGTEHLVSGFAQDEISMLDDRVRLTLGAKLEHNEYTGFEIQPGARLAWLVDDRSTLWASVTRAVRRPSGVERRFLRMAVLNPANQLFFRLLPNESFQSEKLVAYEGGYRLNLGERFYARFAVFYNAWDDLLSTELMAPVQEPAPSGPDLTVYPLTFGNGIDGNTHGGEVAADFRLTSWWHANASYSYLRVRTTAKPSSADISQEEMYDGGSPRHQVVTQQWLGLPGGIELDWTLRYVSKLPVLDIPAYSSSSVRIAWQATDQLQLHVVGENLHEDHHAEWPGDEGGDVEIERRFHAGLTWRP
ncbi:MAG: TonB-dependent receptor plug domain-containing protein [Gemmatimonadales bacterium]